MLSERERRQWADIEQQLRRDPRFDAYTRQQAAQRPLAAALAVMAVLAWSLLTPLLAWWWNPAGALVVTAVVTAVMTAAGWIYGRHRA